MNLERVSDVLSDVLKAQDAVLGTLERAPLKAEQLNELLLLNRQVGRLTELTTISLLNSLRMAGAFSPNSRASSNNKMHQGRFGRRELKAATQLAEELHEQPPTVGQPEPVPPRLPTTAALMREAHFGQESALVISQVLDEIPADATEQARAWAEETLANMACTLAPDDLRKAGMKILQGFGADSEPADDKRQRKRSITLSAQDADLMGKLSGAVSPKLHSLLSRLFADYARPGDLLPEQEKANDTRTVQQRRHDALVRALEVAVGDKGKMRATRGCSAVVVTMTIEQLHAAAGLVMSDVGTMLPIKDLLRLGAEKNAFLAILDSGTGNLIELGKSKRQADLYAYLGLVASQGGDMTPGSSLPAALCELHHLLAWRHGGRSTGDNLALVGHNTHDNIDDDHVNPDKFWTLCDKTGQMLWMLPRKVDPHRRPQANFNPMTWFNPGQMLRFGLHRPDPIPPFQMR